MTIRAASKCETLIERHESSASIVRKNTELAPETGPAVLLLLLDNLGLRLAEVDATELRMAQTSDELKHDIEQTREQMDETADALAYKADVPTRTKKWMGYAVVSAVTGATSKGSRAPRLMGSRSRIGRDG